MDHSTDYQLFVGIDILFVGIDWKRKGGPTLLAGFDKVAAQFLHATLTIAGCAPELSHPLPEAAGAVVDFLPAEPDRAVGGGLR